MASLNFTQTLRSACENAGFSAVGLCPIGPADTYEAFQNWVKRTFHGTMTYLSDHRKDLRKNIQSVFPDAQSLVMVTWPYDAPPQSGVPIAAYATQEEDYHHGIRRRLKDVLSDLQRTDPYLKGWIFVDTHPILERDYAVQTGLGWVGKNTCLIHRDRGSFFTIGGMALNKPLDPTSSPNRKSYCGSCRQCLDACPTQAFNGPHQLDAKKCIAYLTIEYRGVIPIHFFKALKGHFFGCDICQTVCPWNRKWVQDSQGESRFDAMAWLSLSPKAFKEKISGSALSRMRFDMMQRNAVIQLIHQVGIRKTKASIKKLSHATDLLWEQLKELTPQGC